MLSCFLADLDGRSGDAVLVFTALNTYLSAMGYRNHASFGWQLKAARTALGLTLDDIAGRAGVNRNSVHRVENASGRVGGCALAVVSDVFSELGVGFAEVDGRASVSLPNLPSQGI